MPPNYPNAALFPSASFFPGSSTDVGGTGNPLVRCLISTDAVGSLSPVYNIDASARMRSGSSKRGRGTELDDFDPATCSVLLDNRDRALDPGTVLKPRMRIWIFEEFAGEIQDIFKGYIDSVIDGWDPSGQVDQVVAITASDETKRLNLANMPVTDPPRSSYAEVVAFDNPSAYWSWSDATLTRTINSEGNEEVGIGDWVIPAGGGFGIANDSGIVGDLIGNSEDGSGGCLSMGTGHKINNTSQNAGDALGGSYFAIEFWFMRDLMPGSDTTFMSGPGSASFGANPIWNVLYGAAGNIVWSFVDSGGTTRALSGSTSLAAGVWYHVVCELNGGAMKTWINGAQDATGGSGTGAFTTVLSAPNMTVFGAAALGVYKLDELAIYNRASTNPFGSRALAHYTAGAARGFPSQLPGTRAAAIISAIGRRLSLLLSPGTRTMQPAPMADASALTHLRLCDLVESPDGAVFITRSGALKLLAADHRSSAPYNTVQATFGDAGGAELPYTSITPDYSDSRIVNEWNATRIGRGGVLQTASDATSKDTYGPIPQSLTDIPVLVNADVATIAAALLAKTKDPMQRITSISCILGGGRTDVALAVFRLDLLDRIRLLKNRVGGGARFDQTLFVQSIELSWGVTPATPVQATLGVSPV